MLNRNEILLFLKENKLFLQKEFHLVQIGLAGSYSRDEQKEDSDIDILVDFEPNTPKLFDLHLKLKDFLSNNFKKEIDLGSVKYLKPYYKEVILKDAIFV